MSKWLRTLAFLTAITAVPLLLFSGLGVRAGAWDYRFGLTLLRYAAYVGIATTVLALAALAVTGAGQGSRVALVLALAAGMTTVAIPYTFSRTAGQVPAIHDITTDMSDPPVFVDVLPLRADARKRAEYGGDSIAALQRSAYPDVQPIMLDVAPDRAFTQALAAAERMGWDIGRPTPRQGVSRARRRRAGSVFATTW